MKNTLADFEQWQAGGPERSVSIKIQQPLFKDDKLYTPETRIWVYDYLLMVGQYVNSVEEIDLEAEKEKEERAALDKLQKKYGGAR